MAAPLVLPRAAYLREDGSFDATAFLNAGTAFLNAGYDIKICGRTANKLLDAKLTKGERKPVYMVSAASAKGGKLKKLKKGSPARKGKGTKRKHKEPYEFLASGSEIGSEITPVQKLSKKEKAAI